MPDADVTTPLSIPFQDAARRLSISRFTLRGICERGVFTVLAPHGRGPGRPLFLLTAEVGVYDRTRSEDAVREYRRRVAEDLSPADLGEAGA